MSTLCNVYRQFEKKKFVLLKTTKCTSKQLYTSWNARIERTGKRTKNYETAKALNECYKNVKIINK